MTSEDFFYDINRKVFHITKKLTNGFVARIYFERWDTFVYKNKSISDCYNVCLIIGKSKKDLNNFYFGLKESPSNFETSYVGFGLDVLLWCKNTMLEFQRLKRSTICVTGSDTRRYNIYKNRLKDFKETSYKNFKFLIKLYKKI